MVFQLARVSVSHVDGLTCFARQLADGLALVDMLASLAV